MNKYKNKTPEQFKTSHKYMYIWGYDFVEQNSAPHLSKTYRVELSVILVQ